jgi:predicted Zn-dependent protease
VQGQLNFSREMEREADRIGWGVYSTAGFAPVGFSAMFEKLDYSSRLNDNGSYPYLRSHPLTVERIGEARARFEAIGGSHGVAQVPLDHLLMQARARVLMDSSVMALHRQQALDASSAATAPAERAAALYASAIASLQLREPARAQSALEGALAQARIAAPNDARAAQALRLILAQTQQASGHPGRALALLESAPAGSSLRPLLLARAQADLESARAGDPVALRSSTEALQTWVSERQGDVSAWSQLAQCAEALGLHLRSLRAEAEARAAAGDITGAIDRLRSAQRQAQASAGPPDFIEASIIDTRLRDLNAVRRAQLAEARGERGARQEPQ